MKKAVLVLMGLMMTVSASAFASGGYSAIAYDQATGKWGRAQGSYSQPDAINVAESECLSAGGVSCAVYGWALNGYVSLAIGDGNHFGFGSLHDTQYDADMASINVCSARTTNCNVAADASAFAY